MRTDTVIDNYGITGITALRLTVRGVPRYLLTGDQRPGAQPFNAVRKQCETEICPPMYHTW